MCKNKATNYCSSSAALGSTVQTCKFPITKGNITRYGVHPITLNVTVNSTTMLVSKRINACSRSYTKVLCLILSKFNFEACLLPLLLHEQITNFG